MTSVQSPGGSPKPGWYDDPQIPGQDRWWNGDRWGDATARSPRGSLFGSSYARSLRAGLNRDALAARIFSGIGLGVLAVGIWVGAVASVSVPRFHSVTLTAEIVAVVSGAIGLLFSIRALKKAPRLGAFALSIHAIVTSSIAIVVGGLGVLITAVVSTIIPTG